MGIPVVVDLTSILNHSNEDDRNKAVNELGNACLEFGFLQIINHGLPDELINRTRELTQQFFDSPFDEKCKCKPVSTVLPAGYGKMNGLFGSNEWLMVCQPCLGVNVFPSSVPHVRYALYCYAIYFGIRKGSLIEVINGSGGADAHPFKSL